MFLVLVLPCHAVPSSPSPFSRETRLRTPTSLTTHLLPNRHATRLVHLALRPRSSLSHLLGILLVHASSPLQQALLDRAARLTVAVGSGGSQRRASARDAAAAVLVLARAAGVGVLLREVRDGVRGGVLAAQAADERVVGFAGFGHGVVARVEVFALLQLVLQQVFFVGQLAVEAEELLFFLREGLLGEAVSGWVGLAWGGDWCDEARMGV